jgi:hypothetical protein
VFSGVIVADKCRFSPFWEIAGTTPRARERVRRVLLTHEDELLSHLHICYSAYDEAMRSFPVRRGTLLISSIAPYRSFPPVTPSSGSPPGWLSPGSLTIPPGRCSRQPRQPAAWVAMAFEPNP